MQYATIAGMNNVDFETMRVCDCPEIVKIVDFVTISRILFRRNAFGRISCQIIDLEKYGIRGVTV